jgi:hypothetical protein
MWGKKINVKLDEYGSQHLLCEEAHDISASHNSPKYGLDLAEFYTQPQIHSKVFRAYIITLHALAILLLVLCLWLSSPSSAPAIHYTSICKCTVDRSQI